MTTKDATDKLIPLDLTIDELGWLRTFLDQERGAAEVDRANARDFHNALAARTATGVLDREIKTMTTIIDKICATIDIVDAHESLARKIAATLPAQPPVA